MTTGSLSTESNNSKVIKAAPNYTFWFILISLLLAGILGLLAYNSYSSYQQTLLAESRAIDFQTRVAAVQQVANSQRDIILDLIVNYEQDAYDNPQLDRIAEQQLIATEYTLRALQVLAIQNSQIMELLAATP